MPGNVRVILAPVFAHTLPALAFPCDTSYISLAWSRICVHITALFVTGINYVHAFLVRFGEHCLLYSERYDMCCAPGGCGGSCSCCADGDSPSAGVLILLDQCSVLIARFQFLLVCYSPPVVVCQDALARVSAYKNSLATEKVLRCVLAC